VHRSEREIRLKEIIPCSTKRLRKYRSTAKNPQTEYQHVPDYYQSRDVPHVLARIKAFDRFFDFVDQKYRDVYVDLYAEHLRMLERDLQPYALSLALSLIALENSLLPDTKNASEKNDE
jgi:hypothetical protein